MDQCCLHLVKWSISYTHSYAEPEAVNAIVRDVEQVTRNTKAR